MKSSISKLAILALAAHNLSGCSTVSELNSNRHEEKIYVGTKTNWTNLNANQSCGSNMGCVGHMFDKPIAFIDFIPSLLFDTLLLPYTIPYDLLRKKEADGTHPELAKP
jgi:uncharacterized protein YceK